MRNLIIILFLLIANTIIGQTDSITQTSISILLGNRSIPTSGANYKTASVNASWSKNTNTIIPSYELKSIHSQKGHQMGLDYYKKWNGGYGHLGLHYSPNYIFPRLIAKGNIYLTLVKNLELEGGGTYTKYADQTSAISIGLGATYYWKDFLFSSRAQYLVESNINHRTILRKYLSSRFDYVQFGFYRGLDTSIILANARTEISINTYQFALYKKLFNKLQINFIADITRSSNDKNKNQYFNLIVGIKKWLN